MIFCCQLFFKKIWGNEWLDAGAKNIALYNPIMIEKSVYRIIDANFNRAREALRVIEEYCRFVLNHGDLSARAKHLRHQLSQSVGQIPPIRLLTSRDSAGDVGAETQVEGQHRRRSLTDCLTAGNNRLSEALRALAESIQIIDPILARIIERLRFQGYELAKDIAILGIPSQRYQAVRLYVLISEHQPEKVLTLTRQCITGGADCIQLRVKGLSDLALLGLARPFVELCAEAGIISIINDRIDIAVAAGAGGVHLGANDLSVETARQLQTEPLVIGCTSHSMEELKAACKMRPTYIALGPAYATITKPDLPTAGLEYIRQGVDALKDTPIGHVAIGGITLKNVSKVIRAGAQTVAVCAAVTHAADPSKACQAFRKLLQCQDDSLRAE